MPLVFTSCEGTLDDIFGEWNRPTPPTPTATIKFTAMNESQDADNKVPKDVTIAKLTLKSSCLPNGQLVLDDQITSPANSVTVSIPNPPSGEQSYDFVATDTEGNEWTAEGISLTLNQGNNPDKTVVLFNANHFPLTFEATENATTITFSRNNGTDNLSGIYYAIDGEAKAELSGTSQDVSLQAGQRIQFFSTKSAVGDYMASGKSLNITTDKKCYAYGNVMSLIDDEANGFHKDVTITGNDAFTFLFYNNANLYDHEKRAIVLPATTLKDYCYTAMFQDCTSLISAPELAAITLAIGCYCNMFQGCTKLTSAPELAAETLVDYCYQMMFDGCTKLTSVTCKATNIDANSCLNKWLDGAGTEATSPKLHILSTDANADANWNLPTTPDTWQITRDQ